MKLSRVVAARVVVAVVLFLPSPAVAQSAPKLSKSQRALLEATVVAVDQAAATGTVAAAHWQSHLLRASDGSHYVAWSAFARDAAPPKDGAVLYVRLATRPSAGTSSAVGERSAVAEWLKGLRGDPLPMRAGRSMTVPQGEMPIGGAAALGGRPGSANAGATEASNALRLQDLVRERTVRERAEREKQRRAELESAGRAPAPAMHPFEDFDLEARFASGDAGLTIERGFTAGPGDYDLHVAWAEAGAGNRPPLVRVITQRLTLPGAAATDFRLSDIVVADTVRTLAAPYPVAQQGAHPYALGALEVMPARDRRFRVDEALSVVFQVINPTGTAAGTPDVEVNFRVTRLSGTREELVGTLPVQRYHGTNLPGDFDVGKGHPLFAAVQAPLRAFARGRYRLAITALDHLSGRRATGEVTFDVTGTPESLLREAPTPGQAFRRDAVLTPTTLEALARALTPPAPSAALSATLALVPAGRYAELMQIEVSQPAERATGMALRGLALYGLGDSPRAVAAQLQQAATQGAPAAPVQLLLGAVYALGGDDRAAVTAWNLAREGGIDDAAVATLVVDAYMRQGDVARAGAMARAALDSQPGNPAAIRALAATFIATARYADALGLLDTREAAASADPDTDFLVLQALFATLVLPSPSPPGPGMRVRFDTQAARYLEGQGRHAELVRAWLDVLAELRR